MAVKVREESETPQWVMDGSVCDGRGMAVKVREESETPQWVMEGSVCDGEV